MRLIDADELLLDNTWEWYDEYGNLTVAGRAVENAPTVDAVPIIRCKDCVNWKQLDTAYITHADGTPVYSCPLYDDWGDEDGWCCYAERKDNEID